LTCLACQQEETVSSAVIVLVLLLWFCVARFVYNGQLAQP
jgi:hypothetical protein